jgi:hypothetical protein
VKGLLYIVPTDLDTEREWTRHGKVVRGERREITKAPTAAEINEIVGGYIEAVPGFTSVDIDGEGAVPCVAFCNEDGKRLGLATNRLATVMWNAALVRAGHPGLLRPREEGGGLADYLVGTIVVVRGDRELMEAL